MIIFIIALPMPILLLTVYLALIFLMIFKFDYCEFLILGFIIIDACLRQHEFRFSLLNETRLKNFWFRYFYWFVLFNLTLKLISCLFLVIMVNILVRLLYFFLFWMIFQYLFSLLFLILFFFIFLLSIINFFILYYLFLFLFCYWWLNQIFFFLMNYLTR